MPSPLSGTASGLNPDDDELYLNLARIYVTMGERDKARAVLDELMERKPGNATATKALGGIGGKMIPVIVLLIEAIALSGRVVNISEPPSERLSPPMLIAPGAPPVLSFRYFDATDRGRFGNLGLMTDDAGH